MIEVMIELTAIILDYLVGCLISSLSASDFPI